MGFVCRSKYRPYGCFSLRDRMFNSKPDGSAELTLRHDFKELPSVESHSVDMMLKKGVPMKSVSTKFCNTPDVGDEFLDSLDTDFVPNEGSTLL